MTNPLRHTKHEMENAAILSAKYDIDVRLEPNGAITFLNKESASAKKSNKLDQWMAGNEGKNARGA